MLFFSEVGYRIGLHLMWVHLGFKLINIVRNPVSGWIAPEKLQEVVKE